MRLSKHNGNGHDPRHQTETPDVSYIKNVDVTHEASDVSVSGVLSFVAALTAMMAVVFVLTWGIFRFLNAQETEKEPDPGPMAMKPEDRLPPEPRLQAARGFGIKLQSGEWVNLENREPEAEYRVLRAQWDRILNCKSDDSEQSKVEHAAAPSTERTGTITSICIPIESAMQQVVEGGTLKSRGPGAGSRTTGMVPAPTAWSSGRVTGKEQ